MRNSISVFNLCFVLAILLGIPISSGAGTIPLNANPKDFQQVINRAKAQIFPAVVFIQCLRETNETGKNMRHGVSGSGVVISAKGEVVTNWHVIDQAVEVRCLLNDGSVYDAEVIGSDKDTDIALLQLQQIGDESLPFAEVMDGKELEEGDFVMALGAPWGLNRSVSFGIIACKDRYLPTVSEYCCWIQTDASISPGNSGGPLVDTTGRVIGINTRGTMQGGDMGFAIPGYIINEVVPRLRTYGDAKWGWTGLRLQPLRDFQRNIYFEGDSGVIVSDVEAGSPSDLAGLKPLDRLIAIGDSPVTAIMEEDLPAVRRKLALLPEGEPIDITVVRSSEDMELALTPLAKGSVQGEEFSCERWDFSVKTINKYETPNLYFQNPEGVYVYGIRYPGNSQNAGIMRRDVLLKVNGLPVNSLEEVRKLHAKTLENLEKGGPKRIVFSLLRNNRNIQAVVDISRDYSDS